MDALRYTFFWLKKVCERRGLPSPKSLEFCVCVFFFFF